MPMASETMWFSQSVPLGPGRKERHAPPDQSAVACVVRLNSARLHRLCCARQAAGSNWDPRRQKGKAPLEGMSEAFESSTEADGCGEATREEEWSQSLDPFIAAGADSHKREVGTSAMRSVQSQRRCSSRIG